MSTQRAEALFDFNPTADVELQLKVRRNDVSASFMKLFIIIIYSSCVLVRFPSVCV